MYSLPHVQCFETVQLILFCGIKIPRKHNKSDCSQKITTAFFSTKRHALQYPRYLHLSLMVSNAEYHLSTHILSNSQYWFAIPVMPMSRSLGTVRILFCIAIFIIPCPFKSNLYFNSFLMPSVFYLFLHRSIKYSSTKKGNHYELHQSRDSCVNLIISNNSRMFSSVKLPPPFYGLPFTSPFCPT